MDDTWIDCIAPPWWMRLLCRVATHDWYTFPAGLKLRRECTRCHLVVFADGNTGYARVPKQPDAQQPDEAMRADGVLADEIDTWLRRRRMS